MLVVDKDHVSMSKAHYVRCCTGPQQQKYLLESNLTNLELENIAQSLGVPSGGCIRKRDSRGIDGFGKLGQQL